MCSKVSRTYKPNANTSHAICEGTDGQPSRRSFCWLTRLSSHVQALGSEKYSIAASLLRSSEDIRSLDEQVAIQDVAAIIYVGETWTYNWIIFEIVMRGFQSRL